MRVICVDDATVILQHTLKLLEEMPQIDEVRGEYNNDPDVIREECFNLTGIDVADTTTKKREGAKVV